MGWTEAAHNLCSGERLRFWSLVIASQPLCAVSALVPAAPVLCQLPLEAGQQQQQQQDPPPAPQQGPGAAARSLPVPGVPAALSPGVTQGLRFSTSAPSSAVVLVRPRASAKCALKRIPEVSVERAFLMPYDPEKDARSLTVW